jgi:excinuclease UvrABC nuclease subunit
MVETITRSEPKHSRAATADELITGANSLTAKAAEADLAGNFRHAARIRSAAKALRGQATTALRARRNEQRARSSAFALMDAAAGIGRDA